MARTDQEIYDAVREAIFQISTGAASQWTVNGQLYHSIDLETLKDMETEYGDRLNSAKNNGLGRGIVGTSFR